MKKMSVKARKEIRYVIEEKINRSFFYSVKDGYSFCPGDDSYGIAYCVEEHGYKTKSAAEKTFAKKVAERESCVKSVSILKFTLEYEPGGFSVSKMTYTVIESLGFECP